jgi:hypothetical protein
MSVAKAVGTFVRLADPGSFLFGEGIACAEKPNNGLDMGIRAWSINDGGRRLRSGGASDWTGGLAGKELVTLVVAASGEQIGSMLLQFCEGAALESDATLS